MPGSTRRGDARPRRRVGGGTLGALAAVVLLLVAAAGGAYLLLHRTSKQKQQRAAEQAAQAYLSAWTAADYGGMAAASTGTPAVIGALDRGDRTSLQVTSASFDPGKVTRLPSGAGFSAAYTAHMALKGLGDWSYGGTLPLQREGDQWRVQFSPAALHPQLAPGLALGRLRAEGRRGRLLAANGTPLEGADTELDANLIGTVGPLTADEAASAGHQAGDVSGQSGLQRAYDSQLGGRAGGRVVLRRGTAELATLSTFPATAGKDVRTTLNLAVQKAGEQVIGGLSHPAALAAVDSRTGSVLALVNNPVGGFGRVLRGQYPPGSTYKIVTATAALMAGLTEQSAVQCPASVVVSGLTFKNAKKEALGALTLRSAFAQSCNTAFVNLRRQIHETDMKRAAELYGFDGTPPLPIASAGGTYPPPSGPVDEAASAFGQAAVVASPLQMASVAAAVASGTWHQPFVSGASPRSHPLPATVVPELQDMMRAVVLEGTAAPVAFPGAVFGKTGTAEFGSAPKGTDLPTHAWFVGYRGTLAFAVIVEDGGFGADVAAPLASRFLSAVDASGATP